MGACEFLKMRSTGEVSEERTSGSLVALPSSTDIPPAVPGAPTATVDLPPPSTPIPSVSALGGGIVSAEDLALRRELLQLQLEIELEDLEKEKKKVGKKQ